MSSIESNPSIYLGVMVSSTFEDLKAHRKILIDAINSQELKAINMESDGAKVGGDVLESSLDMARKSSAYVCIISHKYGQIPNCQERNPEGLSLTELEFREARRLRRPMLVFIMGDQHDVKLADVEQDANKKIKLAAFRETVKQSASNPKIHRVYNIFNSINEFQVAVTKSIAELKSQLFGDLKSILNTSLHVDRSTNSNLKGTKEPSNLRVDKSVDRTALFSIPEFHDAANRSSLKEELIRLLSLHPTIVVGGLSGNGKSNLLSTCIRQLVKEGRYTDAFWHEPLPEETIDALFSKLDPKIQHSGASSMEKARRLAVYFCEQNTVLIIEDFHQVNHESYQVLVDAFIRIASPARLILISQINLGMQGLMPSIPHLTVPGLTADELALFIETKAGLTLPAPLLEKLLEKTDGLPLAIDFFLVLVQLGSSPEILLNGNMLVRDRIRSWFRKVEEQGGGDQSKLLNLLSLCNGPFNMGVVQMLCRFSSIQFGDNVFEGLQRRYLVQQYSPFRWKLHHIVKVLCGLGLDETQKKIAHLELGRYYVRTARRIAKLYSAEQTFLWQLQACNHLQYAGEYKLVAEALCGMAKQVKHRGYYDLFIQIANAIPESDRDANKWLTYHFAHCCLITGRFKASLKMIEPVIYDKTTEISIRISCARLYAEIQEAIGNPEEALVRLLELERVFSASDIPKQLISHLDTVKVRVLTAMGRYEEAEKISQSLFTSGLRDRNKRGQAIALTGWGVICEAMMRFQVAEEILRNASRLFRAVDDNRGFAWSSSHQAFCLLHCGDKENAQKILYEALVIKGDIDEVSKEYHRFLVRAETSFNDKMCGRLISREIARVSRRLLELERRDL